jgi:hypothetical protein
MDIPGDIMGPEVAPDGAPDVALPIPYLRRLDRIPERTLYVARPGLRALPSGALTVGAFLFMQATSLVILLWAIWWPAPTSASDWRFSILVTLGLGVLIVIVALLLLRRHPGFLIAVLRSPFIRLTVTDQRLVWTLPWMAGPLLEIGRERILGALVGTLDRRGGGSAAVLLVVDDPCADIDGAIHFDRLPQVEAFVGALG